MDSGLRRNNIERVEAPSIYAERSSSFVLKLNKFGTLGGNFCHRLLGRVLTHLLHPMGLLLLMFGGRSQQAMLQQDVLSSTG